MEINYINEIVSQSKYSEKLKFYFVFIELLTILQNV